MLVCEMVQCSNSHFSAYKGDQCFNVFKDNISGENVVFGDASSDFVLIFCYSIIECLLECHWASLSLFFSLVNGT